MAKQWQFILILAWLYYESFCFHVKNPSCYRMKLKLKLKLLEAAISRKKFRYAVITWYAHFFFFSNSFFSYFYCWKQILSGITVESTDILFGEPAQPKNYWLETVFNLLSYLQKKLFHVCCVCLTLKELLVLYLCFLKIVFYFAKKVI